MDCRPDCGTSRRRWRQWPPHSPDAVTMHKGIAASAWQPYAGRIPLIVQSTAGPARRLRPGSRSPTRRMPCDWGPMALPWRHLSAARREAAYLRTVADCVRQAARFEMPVICHIYPRDAERQDLLHAGGYRLGGAVCRGGGRGRGENALLRRRAGLRANRRRLPRAAGRRRRSAGRHAPRGAGNGRPGGPERRPRSGHRPEYLGL